MSMEHLKSLGHYVYGYRDNLGGSTYAYIGVGQNGRVLEHLKEDKADHIEFQAYLDSIGRSTKAIDILSSNIETQRHAEVLESYLINQYQPRLNRNKGNVRGALHSSVSYDASLSLFTESQWDPSKESGKLISKYGIDTLMGMAEFKKNASSIKISTNNKQGVFYFMSFDKKGTVFGLGCTKGMDVSDHIQGMGNLGLHLKLDQDTTRSSQDFYITNLSSEVSESDMIKFMSEYKTLTKVSEESLLDL